MKKVMSIIIIVSLVLGSLGAIASSEDEPGSDISKNESLTISKPTITNTDEYVSVDFEEATSFILEPGKPMLPVFTKVFVLPFGSTIVDVDVSFSNENTMTVSKYVKPAPEPEPLNNVNQILTDTNIDNSIYDSAEVFPSEPFSYSTGGGLQDNEHVTFLSVRCYPVRYSPASNILYYSKDIDVDVVYDEPANPVSYGDAYDLVIITPSKFENSLQNLVEHKNQYNVETFVKTTEDIYSEYSGYDTAEKIKYFLKDAIEELGAEYALIVGDMDNVPMRLSAIEAWDTDGIPTDMYYADIYDSEGAFLSWDSNGNGLYGEYDWRDGPIDEIDLHPDINIGRLACRNKIDVLITTNKIIDYETQSNGESWCNKIVLMGGDTFPGHGVIEGEVVTEEISQQMSSFESVKLWTSTGNYGPLKINSAITSGACFVSYSGHGYEFGFGTSPPNVEKRIEYYTPYTLGMLNSKKYPVIFFDACSTSKLDYNIGGIKLPCFAWYLVKKPIGGAVVTIGATRVAYTHVDHQGIHGGAGYLNVHFFKAYEPGIFVADMMTATQNDYVNYVGLDALTLEEFILIGDPSLKVGGYSNTYESDIQIKETNQGIISHPNRAVNLEATVGIDQTYTVFWDLDDDGSFDDAEGLNAEWTWNSPGTYQISVKLVDANNNIETDNALVNILSKPEVLTGPRSGSSNEEYTYTIIPVSNPSWGEVYYLVDWGDGSFSDTLGPYSNNQQVQISHSWKNSGSYKIRIKTMGVNPDIEGYEESDWSDFLSVSIPRSRNSNEKVYPAFIELLFRYFPRLESLVKNLY